MNNELEVEVENLGEFFAAAVGRLPNGLAPDVEHWRAVNGFLNYQVSSHGRIRNSDTARILRVREHKDGYLKVDLRRDGTRKTCYVHRLVAEAWLPNLENKSSVDHADGNKTNNVLQNLRWATPSENMRNRKKQSNNTSGHKGVSFDKGSGKWRARIQVDGHYLCLGRFDRVEEAAEAYRRAALQHFGEFARLE